MSENTLVDEKESKNQDQLNMRLYEDDRNRLKHLQNITGVGNRSEMVRYALKFTADRHPVPLPPNRSIQPECLSHIAGLTGLLGAFFTAASRQLDKKAEEYHLLMTGLLLNIGDPIELCALFAEYLVDQMVVLRHSRSTYLQYERATELLARYGIDLEDRIVSDQKRGTPTGEPAYRLYLDDLLAIYTQLLEQYRGAGEHADFVTRLRRYAGLILQQEKN